MEKRLTQAELDKRMAAIDARTPERLTAQEEASLQEAMAMDDGQPVSLEAFSVHGMGKLS